MAITFCTLLWPREGMADALVAYEDTVLRLVAEHGGTILARFRTDGSNDQPFEIQLFEFASQEHLDAYLSDGRRLALADERERAIERSELLNLTRVADLA